MFGLLFILACSDGPSEPPPTEPPATTTTSTEAPQAEPRNVVIVSMDTVSAEHMSLFGGPAQTPNIAAIAEQGVAWSAITHFPETAVAHWSLMTGVLPAVHGDVPAFGRSRYTGPTLAEHLKAQGYQTGAFIGGETLTDRSTGLSRGFDVYDDRHPWDRADLKRPGQEVTASALKWIDHVSNPTRPYFAFIHYFDAHFPYTPAPPWDTAYLGENPSPLGGSDEELRPYRDGERTPSAADVAKVAALYRGEISELDAILGPLLQRLAEQPNTTVIITSDHGESFAHDYWFNHRDGLWDEVIRVPLIWKGPGFSAATAEPPLVGLVDVVPTLLHALDLPAIPRIHGTVALNGPVRTMAYAVTDSRRPRPQFAARSSTHKLIAPVVDGRIQANSSSRYDLSSDPNEVQPTATLPDAFTGIEAAYQGVIQPVIARSQGPEPAKRTPDHSEHERLRALGYVDGPSLGERAPK